MKVFIFCGGKATRFNNGKPGPLKTLKKVNKYSILENILINLKKNKLKDIYLLGGYKIAELNEYIKNLKINSLNINLINSKINTNTGGRLLFIKNLIKKDEKFLLTYGDTIVNYNHNNAIKNIKNSDNFVITCYKKKFSYGRILSENNSVKSFQEKSPILINAGYYILDKRIFKYILSKSSSFERDVLPAVLLKSKIKLKINYVDKWIPIDNNEDLKIAKSKFNF